MPLAYTANDTPTKTVNLTDPEKAQAVTRNATISETSINFIPRILVIGVGGGGGNAVDNMIALDLQGVDFVIANTDAQQLRHSRAERRIQLGPRITQGFGAGAKPEIGRLAAEETADELYRHLDGAHMVFITAGMGGGTGTGAAPVIARLARERNILTVGVVTKPFSFEGGRRARAADAGIKELQKYVDTLIVIPNQSLFRMANERTTWKEAFKIADHVLYMGVRGVTDRVARRSRAACTRSITTQLASQQVRVIHGRAELKGPHEVVIDTNGVIEELSADFVVVATGSRPRVPDFVPVDGERILTTRAGVPAARDPRAPRRDRFGRHRRGVHAHVRARSARR